MKYKLSLLTLMFLLGSIVAFAQAPVPASLAGLYEGMVKMGNGAEEKIALEVKNDGGKISARATHGPKSVESTEGKLENGTLTLNFGKDHSFVGKIEGDKLVGEVMDGAHKIPIELKKVTPPASASAAAGTPAAPAAAPAAVNLDGQREAVADANGQPFPFVLTLKIDGENVTGASSSQLGEASIKSGTWKDGKLTLEVEGANGVVVMSAIVVEGKLSGEFDFAGQLSGKWVAVKKN